MLALVIACTSPDATSISLPSPAPTIVSTPPPAATGQQEENPESSVVIRCIFYDGLVPRAEADEYVEIVNLGDVAQSIKDWILRDVSEGYPSYIFQDFELLPGQQVRVYTNEVHPEWGGFTFSYGRAVWNNSDPDVAVLFDSAGREVSRKSYPPGC
ncbi:MAG: lamin tail domain-containing protein [Dehalococcoidia bacterium]